MYRLLLMATEENFWGNWANIFTIGSITIGGFLGLCKYFIGKRDKKLKQFREDKKVKQEKLTTVYEDLLKIVSLYPNQTPYDIMFTFSYAPNFHLENFDTVCEIIKYQIEDYQLRLARGDLTYQDEEDIKTEIRNREYYIREIKKTAVQYFKAKEQYEKFRSEDKLIDLFASQEVKDCLVELEVLIHNAFIAGRELKYNNGRDSKLDDVHRKLKYLIRADLGIY
ncbi:hypothetical protein P7J31_10500 [Streptococcus suis]|uniref:hypothetical protein n=1 Tax=Streptococcus suis TaxID=1307 RepID=UPI0038B9C6BF